MPDHYYWITAVLAARGSQRATSATISSLIGSISALPLLMIFSPAGPQTAVGRYIVIGAALCGIAVAVLWRRPTWPSRIQSRGCVVVVTIALSGISLAMSDPVNGIVTTVAFAALASYVVFLHTPRYVLFVLLAVVATIAVPFTRMTVRGDLMWALWLSAGVLTVTLAVSLVSQAHVQLLGIPIRDTDVDPLTGLLTRDALGHGAATLIGARSRQDDRYLVVVRATLDGHATLATTHGSAACDQALVAVAQTLRESTRRNTLLAFIEVCEFVIVDIFTSSDASPLTGRVRSAIKSTPPHLSASIGVVSTPMEGLASCPPDELMTELLGLAGAAMREYEQAGGDCTTATVCARTNTLDRFTHGDEPAH